MAMTYNQTPNLKYAKVYITQSKSRDKKVILKFDKTHTN